MLSVKFITTSKYAVTKGNFKLVFDFKKRF